MRHIGVGFNVVKNGGALEETLFGGERRTAARLTSLALDRSHKSGLFSADKCARAETNVKIKIKTLAEDVFAQKSVFSRLIYGDSETLNCNGVFRADVDISLCGADSVARDSHSFDYNMRVAFKHRTIHKRAGVALVGVAAYVFLTAVLNDGARKLPLLSGREACAASSS